MSRFNEIKRWLFDGPRSLRHFYLCPTSPKVKQPAFFEIVGVSGKRGRSGPPAVKYT